MIIARPYRCSIIRYLDGKKKVQQGIRKLTVKQCRGSLLCRRNERRAPGAVELLCSLCPSAAQSGTNRAFPKRHSDVRPHLSLPLDGNAAFLRQKTTSSRLSERGQGPAPDGPPGETCGREQGKKPTKENKKHKETIKKKIKSITLLRAIVHKILY